MTDLDRTIHEPVRLRIMAILSGVGSADFNFLRRTLGLSRGNLASHVARLEADGYLEVTKSFKGKIPHTDYHATGAGRQALDDYWAALDRIRASAPIDQGRALHEGGKGGQ